MASPTSPGDVAMYGQAIIVSGFSALSTCALFVRCRTYWTPTSWPSERSFVRDRSLLIV